jgi:FkbM family methyltransferase
MLDGVETEVVVERFVVDPTGEVIYAPRVGDRSMSEHAAQHYMQCVFHDQYGARDAISPGMVVLDVGASIGMFTMVASLAGARVVAFEPNPVDRLALAALVESMSGVDVTIRPEAVSDEPGSIRMALSDIPGSSKPIASGNDRLNMLDTDTSDSATSPVPSTTIDAIVQEMGLDRVDVIKVDTEGWEKRVLVGARQTLREHGPLLLVASYHRPEDPQVLPELVRQMAPRYGPAEHPPLRAPECEYSIRMRPRRTMS